MKLRLSRIENEANCMEASRYRRYCDVLRNKRDLERSCEFYRNRTQFLELHERRQLKQANQLRRQKLGPSKCDSTESVTFLTEKPTAPIGESANLQHNLPWWKVRRCQTATKISRRRRQTQQRANSIRQEQAILRGNHDVTLELLMQTCLARTLSNSQAVDQVRRHRKRLATVKENAFNAKHRITLEAIQSKINREQFECRKLEAQLRRSRNHYNNQTHS